ncbi:MAG: hypothetical protein JWM14_1273 [Chitinophagaceae bacterium]|nr:hypothetical protein [Chitinophagaceae bacterium]
MGLKLYVVLGVAPQTINCCEYSGNAGPGSRFKSAHALRPAHFGLSTRSLTQAIGYRIFCNKIITFSKKSLFLKSYPNKKPCPIHFLKQKALKAS